AFRRYPWTIRPVTPQGGAGRIPFPAIMSRVTAQILDGTATAQALLDDTAGRAAEITGRLGRKPCLVTVLVGEDPASKTYVKMKANRAAKYGLESRRIELPATSTTGEVVARVEELSADDTVDGILVQHPVPDQVDEPAVFEAIRPDKDVDGVTMTSFAAMGLGRPGFQSCTPGGIIRLLDAYQVPLAGKHAVVVGRSPILGKPVGLLLLGRDATVTYCHSKTENLADVVRTADLVVAAVGRPELVRGD